jgi:hypothetical protein
VRPVHEAELAGRGPPCGVQLVVKRCGEVGHAAQWRGCHQPPAVEVGSNEDVEGGCEVQGGCGR